MNEKKKKNIPNLLKLIKICFLKTRFVHHHLSHSYYLKHMHENIATKFSFKCKIMMKINGILWKSPVAKLVISAGSKVLFRHRIHVLTHKNHNALIYRYSREFFNVNEYK